MAKIKEVLQAVEELAPTALAQEWDNVGTLVDCGGDVTSIMVSLDITNEVVMEAEAQGCQLIVAHHPVIFKPMSQIVYGDVVYRLVKKSISAICAHSNLDAATGGVNDILAAIFGIVDAKPFADIGRIGQLKNTVTTGQIADICTGKFAAHVRMVDAGRPVKMLAVLGGSGGGLLEEAILMGADCLLTGEADHHDAIDAAAAGISLVAAGHFHTEFPVVPVLADRLQKKFPKMRVLLSKRARDPFTYVDPVKNVKE